VADAPDASLTVTEPDPNVPVAVGVPVNEIVLTDSVAVMPVGRPLWPVMVYGANPPSTAIVPENPG
jgi:hypothetical protein